MRRQGIREVISLESTGPQSVKHCMLWNQSDEKREWVVTDGIAWEISFKSGV
jgi:hypothetical protein